MTMETNLAAAREARRFLTDRVRNDWCFPQPPRPFEHSDEELHGVNEFRERYYGTTSAGEREADENDDHDSDSDDSAEKEQEQEQDVIDGAHKQGRAAEEQGHGASNGTGPYKFDGPDTVGQTMEARAAARAARRKRRRRRALEDEMRWNEGMAVFVRQRDAWTGATSVRKYARRRSRADEQMHPAELEAQRQIDAVLEETAVVTKAPAGSPATTNTPTTPISATTATATTAADDGTPTSPHPVINIDIPASEEPLAPLAPPLLPHNSIRQSITPRAYSDIYAKIVVGGQTPKVPINLSDMTRALVQGWKDDGEWPPKGTAPDPLMGKRRVQASGAKGVIAAALGGGSMGPGGGGVVVAGGGGGARGLVGGGAAAAAHGGEFLAHHPHVKRGVESVKRVFRLSGHHHENGAGAGAGAGAGGGALEQGGAA